MLCRMGRNSRNRGRTMQPVACVLNESHAMPGPSGDGTLLHCLSKVSIFSASRPPKSNGPFRSDSFPESFPYTQEFGKACFEWDGRLMWADHRMHANASLLSFFHNAAVRRPSIHKFRQCGKYGSLVSNWFGKQRVALLQSDVMLKTG